MYNKYIKRYFDMFFSILLLLPLSIITLVIGICIKLDDGGPIFYYGERLGKDKKIFKMYKFRTMKVDAPDIRNEDGSTFNSIRDNRVTKVGRVLRETSLDELPQIFNVLKGDMSFIGPRASLGNSLSTYYEDELDKMKVRPGITGYTQCYFRNNLMMHEKRQKDIFYVNNISFLFDLRIFFKTIQTVIKKEGLYTNDVMLSNTYMKSRININREENI